MMNPDTITEPALIDASRTAAPEGIGRLAYFCWTTGIMLVSVPLVILASTLGLPDYARTMILGTAAAIAMLVTALRLRNTGRHGAWIEVWPRFV